MSRSSLAKKLQPAKKALKRFAKTIQSRIQNLDLSRSIEAVKSNTNRILAYCSRHFFPPFKRRSITKPRYRSHQFNHLYQCNKTQFQNNFLPIYIDQLYGAEASSRSALPNYSYARAETSSSTKGKEVVQEKAILPRKDSSKEREKILYTVEDAWREVVAKSPQLRPVDERAEEFIYKFREEIKLQKERSCLEFEERLKRSA